MAAPSNQHPTPPFREPGRLFPLETASISAAIHRPLDASPLFDGKAIFIISRGQSWTTPFASYANELVRHVQVITSSTANRATFPARIKIIYFFNRLPATLRSTSLLIGGSRKWSTRFRLSFQSLNGMQSISLTFELTFSLCGTKYLYNLKFWLN